MSARGSERSRIRTFFEFDDVIDRPLWVLPLELLQAGVVVYGGWYVASHDRDGRPDVLGYNYLEGVLAGAVLLVLTGLIVYGIQILYGMAARLVRDFRLKRLEAHARTILKSDYKRALKAILKATDFQSEELKPLDQERPCRFETLLFERNELENFLGALADHSLRAVVPKGRSSSFAPAGTARWSGDAFFSGYVMPFRVSCVFFTEAMIVVGEAICDPVTGEMQKRVRQIPRETIRSTRYNTTVRDEPVTKAYLERWFENRRHDREERSRIRKVLEQHDKIRMNAQRYGNAIPNLPYLFRQSQTQLDIQTTAGQTISIPVRHEQAIVRARMSDTMGLESASGFSNELLDDFDDLPLDSLSPLDTDESRWWGSTDGLTVPVHLRALWSTGRQKLYRSYSAFWPFARSTIFGVFVALCSIAVMNAVTQDWTRQYGSTEEDGLRIETPNGEKPLIPDEARLSSDLRNSLSETDSLQFACTLTDVGILAMPAARSGRLASLPGNRPLVVDSSTENAPPESWQRVLFSWNGEILTGYVRSRDLEIYQRGSRTVCPQ